MDPGILHITYLEGHDEMCEVKLCLEVQLDGHILHTCRQQNRFTNISELHMPEAQYTPSLPTQTLELEQPIAKIAATLDTNQASSCRRV